MPSPIHNAEPGFFQRNKRKMAASAAGLAMVGATFAGLNSEHMDSSNANERELAEDSPAAKQLEQLISDGAEVRDQAILLHRGVRQRPEPAMTSVSMGRDSEGTRIPVTLDPTVILKPVVVTNEQGEEFYVMPVSDDELAYVSTGVLTETNDYDGGDPYGKAVDLNPESYEDIRPSSVLSISGGDPGLAAYETELDKAS